jgi:hypothetical protein
MGRPSGSQVSDVSTVPHMPGRRTTRPIAYGRAMMAVFTHRFPTGFCGGMRLWVAHHVGVPPTKRKESGGDLLSHTLPSAVPSALAGLATGFGM